MCLTFFIHVSDLMCLRHIKSMCSCWCVSDTSSSHMWHDSSFILDMTCSFTHVTWPIRIFHMTCSSVWYDPFLNNLNYWVQRDVCQSGGYLTALVQCVVQTRMKPIADTVAQNFEIISEKHESSTRRGRILMGFTISTMLLSGTNRNPMGRILVRWQSFRNHLNIMFVPPYVLLAVHSWCLVVV